MQLKQTLTNVWKLYVDCIKKERQMEVHQQGQLAQSGRGEQSRRSKHDVMRRQACSSSWQSKYPKMEYEKTHRDIS